MLLENWKWYTFYVQCLILLLLHLIIQLEFEAVFQVYGEDVKFTYLKSFGRVRVSYPSSEQASLAQENLNHREFRGSSLKVCSIKVRNAICIAFRVCKVSGLQTNLPPPWPPLFQYPLVQVTMTPLGSITAEVFSIVLAE